MYLPLITTNCGVLGVTMNVIADGMNYGEALRTALGCGLGFFLAMVLFLSLIHISLMHENFAALGVPQYTPEELDFAKKLAATYPSNQAVPGTGSRMQADYALSLIHISCICDTVDALYQAICNG